jgi:hypothetical protein
MLRIPRRKRRAIGLVWRNYTVNDVGGFDRYTEERYKRSEFGQQKRLRRPDDLCPPKSLCVMHDA